MKTIIKKSSYLRLRREGRWRDSRPETSGGQERRSSPPGVGSQLTCWTSGRTKLATAKLRETPDSGGTSAALNFLWVSLLSTSRHFVKQLCGRSHHGDGCMCPNNLYANQSGDRALRSPSRAAGSGPRGRQSGHAANGPPLGGRGVGDGTTTSRPTVREHIFPPRTGARAERRSQVVSQRNTRSGGGGAWVGSGSNTGAAMSFYWCGCRWLTDADRWFADGDSPSPPRRKLICLAFCYLMPQCSLLHARCGDFDIIFFGEFMANLLTENLAHLRLFLREVRVQLETKRRTTLARGYE